VPIWRALTTPAVYEATAEGEAKRRELAASFDVNHCRMHGMVGVESGYSYAGSPLMANEPGNVADWETSRYVPRACPGARIPHLWLKDGRALQDVLGENYTLLDLRGDFDARPLANAFRAIGAPLARFTWTRSGSARYTGRRCSCCALTFTSYGAAMLRRAIPLGWPRWRPGMCFKAADKPTLSLPRTSGGGEDQRLSTAIPQEPARQCAGRLAVFKRDLAVDQDPVVAL
jgi:hypothetical protein